ncbi:MAG: AAA family ATPase [Cyclobacteriaceae bacterium]|nr:AAA family ATPase [Cyclobacteriaceae bacterium]
MKAVLKIQQKPQELIKFQETVLSTYNFKRVQALCRIAMNERLMCLITGETGFGKTTALNYFKLDNKKVIMVTVHASSGSSRSFWASVISSIPDLIKHERVDPLEWNVHMLLRKLSRFLNDNPESLLIIDQANKFSYRGLEYLHELRDLTIETTGIVLSAPAYFKENLNKWCRKDKPGVPELVRRIQHFEELHPPSTVEVKAFCNHYGVEEQYWKELVGQKNFGNLTNKIREVLRNQNKLQ